MTAASASDRRPDDAEVRGRAAIASAEPLTAEAVRDTAFPRPPVGRRGYDPDQVDAFREQIAATLEGRGLLSAEEVRAVAFGAPRPLVRGYDSDAVDDFLDRVEANLR